MTLLSNLLFATELFLTFLDFPSEIWVFKNILNFSIFFWHVLPFTSFLWHHVHLVKSVLCRIMHDTKKKQDFVRNNMRINYEYTLCTYICTICVSMCLVLFEYSALKIDQGVQGTGTRKPIKNYTSHCVTFISCASITQNSWVTLRTYLLAEDWPPFLCFMMEAELSVLSLCCVSFQSCRMF
jgi:hypothetical protein